MRKRYRDTPFYCGTCGKHLHFMRKTYGAWYVHADNHRFHCGNRWQWWLGTSDTNSAPLETVPGS